MASVLAYKSTIFSMDWSCLGTILGLSVGEVRTLQHLKGVFCMKSEGEIERDTVYSIERFMEVTGLKRFALDTARRNGLTVRKVGRRCFIFGQDFIDHITSPETVQS